MLSQNTRSGNMRSRLMQVLKCGLQVYRWYHMKALAYFVELCWISAFCIGAYLTCMWMAPHVISIAAKGVLFRLVFAYGSGPLGVAVTFLGNSLVPHSPDHTMRYTTHSYCHG